MTDAASRYFFDSDDDGHYFMVPAERREEWTAWLKVTEDRDNEEGWNAPEWARPLPYHPSRYTFTDPRQE